jgi:hypothetical protein
MGRLAGFRYREIVRKLRVCGFEFDRQAAGSHEIIYFRREHSFEFGAYHRSLFPTTV